MKKIFDEVENVRSYLVEMEDVVADYVKQETSAHWFGKKWDEGDPVVENLLATMDDYFNDLKTWISGSFFFSKLVRQCLDKFVYF